MTKDQAQAIRAAQLRGEPVSDEDLREALLTLSEGERPARRPSLRKLPDRVHGAIDRLLYRNLQEAMRKA